MTITLNTRLGTLRTARADVIACFLWEDVTAFKRQIKELRKTVRGITPALDAATFAAKELETLLLYPDNLKAKRLLLVGLGKQSAITREKLRRAAAAATKATRAAKAKSLALMAPEINLDSSSDIKNWEVVGTALGEGAILSQYRFDKYVTQEKKSTNLTQVAVVSSRTAQVRQIASGLKLAEIVCAGTVLARDLENAPGNEIYPDSLARRTVAVGKKAKFKVTVLKERAIRRLRMGGLLSVAQGSDNPPRFIVMEYNAGRKRLPTVVFVGKGVTFDSGGISIKPAANMAQMKMDMSGAAAVIGTLQTVARLALPFHVVGLVPATENLLGGGALKPGDIITHYNGKTSEVDNTDAEGRLILADALSYAAHYKPDLVIDLATLTGACVVALGHFATGMLGNNQEKMDELKAAGERTYERVWQLPMFEEYDKLIKSDIADVKNVGGRWGGAITAAFFLKKFIGKYKWVHLDIAGTAIMEESLDYIPRGGSGVGVRLLVDFLRHWNNR